jgi:hypothetical protein
MTMVCADAMGAERVMQEAVRTKSLGDVASGSRRRLTCFRLRAIRPVMVPYSIRGGIETLTGAER